MPSPGPNNIGANLWDQATQGSDHTLQRGQPPMIPGGPNGVIYGPEGIVCADETGQLWIKQSGPESNTGWVEASTGGGGGFGVTVVPPDPNIAQKVGIFVYIGIPGVTSFVWDAVTSSEGMDIESMPDMTFIDAPNLTAISGSGYLTFYSDTALPDISGFSSLISIGGGLFFNSCTVLLDVSGFNSLTSVGTLNFSSNASLVGISGFNSLTSVGAQILFSFNSALADISGFNSLTSVSGQFACLSNSSLTDISGFASLTSIGGPLVCTNNAALASISGLSDLNSVGGLFDCSGCALMDSAVNKCLALLVAATGSDHVTPWAVAANFSGGTNAAPTGQGILDVATLTGRGATVTTN